MARRQSTDHKVGSCACGRPVEIGDRYSLSTERPTTIRRVCGGYNCDRVNEIVVTVSAVVKRVNWAVHECLCGSTVYIRNEYAGYGFKGWEGTGWDALGVRDEDYKNRTVKAPCRGCDCRYSVRIRFMMVKDADGGPVRHREYGVTVRRCRTCRARKDRETANASA